MKSRTTGTNPDLYKVRIGDPEPTHHHECVHITEQCNCIHESVKDGFYDEGCGLAGCPRGRKDKVPYKFREDELMAEIQAYIDATYGQHYSRSKFQASEFIFDNGHGVGMNVGCIMKYAQRYGKKDGHNRKDILKIIHYAILLLYVHDEYIVDKPER